MLVQYTKLIMAIAHCQSKAVLFHSEIVGSGPSSPEMWRDIYVLTERQSTPHTSWGFLGNPVYDR